MPKQRITDETIAAIEAHWARVHEGTISATQIAVLRSGPAPNGVLVSVIPETPESPAWFVCSRCPDGAQRYRTDVGADPLDPPPRHVAAIKHHFRERHGITLRADEIYHDPGVPARVSYGPSTPLVGAHLVCSECPEGVNRVFFEETPYGDARSFSELRRRHPELVGQINGLSPAEQADYWELVHRGRAASATASGVRSALARARAETSAHRLGPLRVGIIRLLCAGVAAGNKITPLIDELVGMARNDPIGYRVRIARHMPEMDDVRDPDPKRIAATLTEFYGEPPTSRRALWDLWRARTEVSTEI